MRIGVIGRGRWMYKTLELLIHSGYDVPLVLTSKVPEDYDIKSIDFEKKADEIGARFIETAKIQNEDVKRTLSEIDKLDIAVSVNYSGVIPQSIIEKFRMGILNAHGGDLPRYRGNACQAWAIINGEDKIGLCIHKMVGGELDSGDIISRNYLTIDIDTRIGEIYDWFDEEIPKMFLHSITKLVENPQFKIESQSIDPSKALRCYPRIPEDGRIDWKLNSEDILRLINATSEPYNGAFTFFNEDRVVIWRARVKIDEEQYLAIPGQISAINHCTGEVDIITGSGKISLIEIEVNGLRIRPSTYFKTIRKRLK